MPAVSLWKEVLTLVPVIALILLGLALVVRSGPTQASSSPELRQWVAHASQTLVWLLVASLALLAIHLAVGLRLSLV